MNNNCTLYVLVFIFVLFTSCSEKRIASNKSSQLPAIYPDYVDVCLPYNIAPINFIVNGGTYVQTSILKDGEEVMYVSSDSCVSFDKDNWKKLLKSSVGSELTVKISVWNDDKPDGLEYAPFRISVSSHPIDPFIMYRLIEPGYESWNKMGLYYRNLESFEEKPLITNDVNNNGCVNCHSFCNYSADNFVFHARGEKGGSIIVRNGEAKKVNLSELSPKKSGTYPRWHPYGRYIAFSSNDTHQGFFNEGIKPIEVYDLSSDIIIYDCDNNKVLADPRFNNNNFFETFPEWFPNGDRLCFCTAASFDNINLPNDCSKLHYSIVSVPFNKNTGKLGTTVDTLYNSRVDGGSASFPRISPDGNFLMFTKAEYGTFPIWHREADLMLLNLNDSTYVNTDIINSSETDSYHSWSSNSKWILFSSRRHDGRYTRLYIALLGDDGHLTKPFALPQKHPENDVFLNKSYNVPEFISGSPNFKPNDFESFFK